MREDLITLDSSFSAAENFFGGERKSYPNIDYREHLALDDILLVPQYSEVESRLDIDISTRLTKNIRLEIPIISASMSTITGYRMAKKMSELGGCGFLHRFTSDEEMLKWCKDLVEEQHLAIPSIGIRDDTIDWIGKLVDVGVEVVSIDIAHAHHSNVLKMIGAIKKSYPKVEVIGGNVSTAEGTKALIEAGVDACKEGQGNGSLCSTRLITGHGTPTVSSLIEVVEIASKYDIPIIADGGIRYSGDIVKCLSLGAETCMIGRLLAGTEETPGDFVISDGRLHKNYCGMSSEAAQIAYRGGLKEGTAPEGESTLIEFKGSVEPIIKRLAGGIRSGLSYSGAFNISELREKARFIRITGSSIIEGKPHLLLG